MPEAPEDRALSPEHALLARLGHVVLLQHAELPFVPLQVELVVSFTLADKLDVVVVVKLPSGLEEPGRLLLQALLVQPPFHVEDVVPLEKQLWQELAAKLSAVTLVTAGEGSGGVYMCNKN